MKNFIRTLLTPSIFLIHLALPIHAQTVQLPDVAMLQKAAIMELMKELSKPGNKVYWLCGQDAARKLQNPSSEKKLSAECRSELNRIVTQNVETDSEEIVQLASKITKGLSYNQEKLEAIYKWVTQNIRYDVATYTDLIKTKKILENPVQMISPLQVVRTETALAEGYSQLTAALLRAANIPAVTIVGLAIKGTRIQGPHAWNEVYIQDRWINLDTTWDAGHVTGSIEEGLVFVSSPSVKYFDLSDAEFKKTHKVIFDIK